MNTAWDRVVNPYPLHRDCGYLDVPAALAARVDAAAATGWTPAFATAAGVWHVVGVQAVFRPCAPLSCRVELWCDPSGLLQARANLAVIPIVGAPRNAAWSRRIPIKLDGGR